jgi:glyoxylase-like metal-dependent hydrolase (beta-lactamase superfamily II)
MRKIDEGIYYEDSFPGVTLGAIIYPDGIIGIDAPIRSEDARAWRSVLMDHRGWKNRFLVSLDSHPDRTLGAKSMETTLITHEKTAEIFQNRSTIFKGQVMETGSEWESYNEAIGMRWAIPEITFSNQIKLHWDNSEVILEHHPGPSLESIWVILPGEKVVFVGDTVVVDQPPFFADADLDLWETQLDILLKSYREFVIISGRGGPIVQQDVHELRKFIRNVSRRMENLANKEASPEETTKMVPSLLGRLKFPSLKKDQYEHRLKYGLFNYYQRRYHQTVNQEHLNLE